MAQAFKGYPEWEDQASTTTHPWVTACLEFPRIGGGEKDAFQAAVDGWLADIETRFATQVFLFDFERARLQADVALGRPTARVVVLIHRKVLQAFKDDPQAGHAPKVLYIGKPFGSLPPELQEKGQNRLARSSVEPTEGVARLPVIGIIDDGIAFLNARFCRLAEGVRKTRFLGVWLQSELQFSQTVSNPPVVHTYALQANLVAPPDAPQPSFLDRNHIDDWLASGRSEAEVYRRINDDLYPLPSQQATNSKAAHGTHVLDLAAGAEPSVGGAPLLAVQLAPGMAHDTSGRRLEAFLLLGLRWMVWRALQENRDLVVNLSLGSLAGPGDRTNFIADAISHEIAFFDAQSAARHPDDPKTMSVVVAYGNSWRANLVAEVTLSSHAQERTLDWRILPEDYSSSYLEIRVPKAAKGVTLTLTPPDGSAPLSWVWGDSDPAVKDPSGRAAILALPAELGLDGGGDAAPILLAVAPTIRPALGPFIAGPIAPAGAWKLTLSRAAGQSDSCTISLRVQRSDTPVGHRVLGRQSYLADPEKPMGWDEETRDYTWPDGTALTRDGTGNAYAGLDDARSLRRDLIFFVGAAERDSASADGYRPQRHTSAGREGSPRKPNGLRALSTKSPGPTFSTLSEDGRFLPGLRAASVSSGARTLRLSGTSMAAGLATRLVAEKLAAGELKAFAAGLKPSAALYGCHSRLGWDVFKVLPEVITV